MDCSSLLLDIKNGYREGTGEHKLASQCLKYLELLNLEDIKVLSQYNRHETRLKTYLESLYSEILARLNKYRLILMNVPPRAKSIDGKWIYVSPVTIYDTLETAPTETLPNIKLVEAINKNTYIITFRLESEAKRIRNLIDGKLLGGWVLTARIMGDVINEYNSTVKRQQSAVDNITRYSQMIIIMISLVLSVSYGYYQLDDEVREKHFI